MKKSRYHVFSVFLALGVLLAAIAYSYYHFATSHEIVLTEAEQQWLEKNRNIRISPNPNFVPIDFFEGDTLYSGVGADLLKEIEHRLPLTFTIVRYNNQAEIYEAINRKETDLLPALVVSEERKQFLLFTEPFLHLQNVIVVRKNDTTITSVKQLAGKRLAIVRGSTVHRNIQNIVPNIRLIGVNSGLESLYEVSFGRADAAIVNLASAAYLIKERDLANLKVAADYSMKLPIAMGVRKDLPELRNILDKAFAAIPEKRKNAILHKWLGLQLQTEWWMELPWQGIGLAVGFLLLASFVIIFWNWSLQKQVRKSTAQLQEEFHARLHIATQLQKSEEKFRRIFTDAPAGVLMLSTEGTILQCNAAYAQTLGYSEEELSEKDFFAFIFPDDQEQVKKEFMRLLTENTEQIQIEYRCLHKNGTVRWLESTLRVLHTIDQYSRSLLAITVDSTERKRTEEINLQYVQELTILQNLGQKVNSSLSTDAVTKFAIDGMLEASKCDIVFLFLRDGVTLRLQGIAPDSEATSLQALLPIHKVGECICGLAARSQAALYSQNIFKDIRCTWTECKKAGIISFAALPMLVGSKVIGVIGLASRKERNFETSARFLETLAATLAVGIQNAVLYTTTIQTEEELRRREEELNSIFRASPIGIGVVVGERITTVNDRVIELTGRSREELVGLPVPSLSPSLSEYQSIENTILKQLKEKGIATIETRLQQKNGNILDIILSVTTISTNTPTPQYIFTFFDITPQKLLQRQLAESQKMESLGTLAGGIAHDFNNILNIIGGYTERLLTHGNDPEIRTRSLNAIMKSVERAAKLVQQILTFARRTQHEETPLNINTLIEELIRMLRETFPRTIEIQETLEPTIPLILGNQSQLHQALLNLAVNARDAMPNGGILSFETYLTPSTEIVTKFPEAQQTSYVTIAVRDTGTGMDSKTLQRIFEPFFTTKEVGKGTGLGLSVVYGVVSAHNGFIDVQSTPGKGTTFFLSFPSMTSESTVAEKTEGLLTSAKITEAVPPKTILVIEDEEPLREILENVLSSGGHRVLLASNGQEGLELYTHRKDEIDLVLSDVGLPKMSGYECFKEMKKLNPQICMILASGYFDPREKEEMLKSGVSAFLQKPYSPTQILTLLNTLHGHTS